MSLFGKKKLSVEDILKGIAELSEEEQATVLSSMQKHNAESASETNDTHAVAEESVEAEEVVENGEPTNESTESADSVEETELPTETVEETTETNVEETEVEEGDSTEPTAETPTETPQSEEFAQEQGQNYDELFAAQNARITSIESQLTALKEKLENVVANQDKQNFGYSPKAHFDENVDTTRMDAVMQGYAPRRADQYK